MNAVWGRRKTQDEPAGRSGPGHPLAYLRCQGKLIEGKSVTPSVPVELLPDDLLAGQDPQMQKAIEIVRGM